jgi:hypothetical protein
MGTGTDFRWVGELRAVAERSYGTTLTGLILRDARAKWRRNADGFGRSVYGERD